MVLSATMIPTYTHHFADGIETLVEYYTILSKLNPNSSALQLNTYLKANYHGIVTKLWTHFHVEKKMIDFEV